MKNTKLKFTISFIFLSIVATFNSVNAAVWGVCNGDDLKYNATHYIDNQFLIDSTTTMTVSFNVTFSNDYVTANMSVDGGPASSVFLNTQSLNPNYGINIKTTNGINTRYIADEQRIQTFMSQLQNTVGAVLSNFTMTRYQNNVLVTAYGGSSTSWTYRAEINYTSTYVLSRFYEDHFQTDGVNDAIETVLWLKVYHHSTCTGNGSPGSPGGSIPGFSLFIVIAALSISLAYILRKRIRLKIEMR
ncbi:MAG: Loki-CTERM sorting domain-containing protein [Promethearchaeota archaeon]|jgi:hypothetical protein